MGGCQQEGGRAGASGRGVGGRAGGPESVGHADEKAYIAALKNNRGRLVGGLGRLPEECNSVFSTRAPIATGLGKCSKLAR